MATGACGYESKEEAPAEAKIESQSEVAPPSENEYLRDLARNADEACAPDAIARTGRFPALATELLGIKPSCTASISIEPNSNETTDVDDAERFTYHSVTTLEWPGVKYVDDYTGSLEADGFWFSIGSQTMTADAPSVFAADWYLEHRDEIFGELDWEMESERIAAAPRKDDGSVEVELIGDDQVFAGPTLYLDADGRLSGFTINYGHN